MTVSNVTIKTFTTLAASVPIIGSQAEASCVPQDDAIQFFHADNIHTTMPENPTGERTSLVFLTTPEASTRRYQYIIRDSLFDDIYNDAQLVYGILGNFKEDVIISNVTISNSQITSSAVFLFTMYNLTIDGTYFESNIINGNALLLINY